MGPGCMRDRLNTQQYQALRRILTEARERTGQSPADVAAKIGKPPSFVADVESGNRGIDIEAFLRLADALDLDAAQVMKELAGIEE